MESEGSLPRSQKPTIGPVHYFTYKIAYASVFRPSVNTRCKGKVVPVLKYAPHHEDALREWRYTSMYS